MSDNVTWLTPDAFERLTADVKDADFLKLLISTQN